MITLEWQKEGNKEVAKRGTVTHCIEPNENGYLYTRDCRYEKRITKRLWSSRIEQLKEAAQKDY